MHCSHASAVGPIDEDQRFYLESRGVPPEVAERLIVAGFFDEVLDQLPVPEASAAVRAAHRRAPRAPRSRRRWRMTEHRVCAVDDVAPARPRQFELVDGHKVAVVRIDDDWYAIGDTCTPPEDQPVRGRGARRRPARSSAGSTAARFSLVTGRAELAAGHQGRARLPGPRRRRRRAGGDHGGAVTSELRIEGLRAEVAGREILQGIDLVVRSGEVHAVMGPNGSGKSTLSHVAHGSSPATR